MYRMRRKAFDKLAIDLKNKRLVSRERDYMKWNPAKIANDLWECGYTSDNYFEIMERFGYTETEAMIICFYLEKREEWDY